jgi:hypothetical protein
MQQKPMGRKQPFISHASLALDKPVMVLTRASIRLSKLIFGKVGSSEQKFRVTMD